MTKQTLTWVMALSLVTLPALAQQQVLNGDDDNNDQAKGIIYKWQQGSKTFYSEWPPHGVENYQRLNNQGMVLNPIPDLNSFLVIRPERPATTPTDNNNKPSPTATATTPLRQGTITRAKRCETARQNLQTISEKQTIFEEDQAHNLIPLTPDEVARRREEAQKEVDSFCSEPKP